VGSVRAAKVKRGWLRGAGQGMELREGCGEGLVVTEFVGMGSTRSARLWDCKDPIEG